MTEFTFKGIVFVVKLVSGNAVYRDKRHLGGPWSNVQLTLDNSSVDSTFKNRLRNAAALEFAKV